MNPDLCSAFPTFISTRPLPPPPPFPIPNKPMVSVRVKHRERRKCVKVKVEVAVLGSPSQIVVNGLCGRTVTLKDVRNDEQSLSQLIEVTVLCGFTKGITPKMCRLCVCVLINKRSFEPFMCLDLILVRRLDREESWRSQNAASCYLALAIRAPLRRLSSFCKTSPATLTGSVTTARRRRRN